MELGFTMPIHPLDKDYRKPWMKIDKHLFWQMN